MIKQDGEDADAKEVDNALSDFMAAMKRRQEDLERREVELEKSIKAFEREKRVFGAKSATENDDEETDGVSPKATDVLHLNVGGTVIAVYRKTITQIEGSTLAAMFSGRWDSSIEKDKDGNFFIDQSPDIFLPLIDFLRDKLCEMPSGPPAESPDASLFGSSQNRFFAFQRMVDFYGLTPGVFPTKIELHNGLPENCQISSYPDLGVNANSWCVFTLQATGHKRTIKSFQVKLGQVDNMQIGWLHNPGWSANTTSVATTRVGDHSNSVSLDLCNPGLRENGVHTRIENFAVESNDTITCSRDEDSVHWYLNGTRIEGLEAPMKGYTNAYYVPAFSGKGTWEITGIELYQAQK